MIIIRLIYDCRIGSFCKDASALFREGVAVAGGDSFLQLPPPLRQEIITTKETNTNLPNNQNKYPQEKKSKLDN